MDLVKLHPVMPTHLTKGQQIKALQQEADACAAEMFREMCDNLSVLEHQINEIKGLGANYKTLTSAAEELAPQVSRWGQVAAAALNKRGG